MGSSTGFVPALPGDRVAHHSNNGFERRIPILFSALLPEMAFCVQNQDFNDSIRNLPRVINQASIAVAESTGTYLDAKVHCFGKAFECRSHSWPDVFQSSRVLRYVRFWTSLLLHPDRRNTVSDDQISLPRTRLVASAARSDRGRANDDR